MAERLALCSILTGAARALPFPSVCAVRSVDATAETTAKLNDVSVFVASGHLGAADNNLLVAIDGTDF
jgi:hypothetical protein